MDNNECGGFSQSPVNLVLNKSIQTNAYRVKCSYKTVNANFSNNGYTLDISPVKSQSGACISPDGRNIYEFEGAHFHWGPNEKIGSEHHVNGKAYPMELHMVHKNTKYSTVEEARQYADGLMVLGYFFSLNVSTKNNLN